MNLERIRNENIEKVNSINTKNPGLSISTNFKNDININLNQKENPKNQITNTKENEDNKMLHQKLRFEMEYNSNILKPYAPKLPEAIYKFDSKCVAQKKHIDFQPPKPRSQKEKEKEKEKEHEKEKEKEFNKDIIKEKEMNFPKNKDKINFNNFATEKENNQIFSNNNFIQPSIIANKIYNNNNNIIIFKQPFNSKCRDKEVKQKEISFTPLKDNFDIPKAINSINIINSSNKSIESNFLKNSNSMNINNAFINTNNNYNYNDTINDFEFDVSQEIGKISRQVEKVKIKETKENENEISDLMSLINKTNKTNKQYLNTSENQDENKNITQSEIPKNKENNKDINFNLNFTKKSLVNFSETKKISSEKSKISKGKLLNQSQSTKCSEGKKDNNNNNNINKINNINDIGKLSKLKNRNENERENLDINIDINSLPNSKSISKNKNNNNKNNNNFSKGKFFKLESDNYNDNNHQNHNQNINLNVDYMENIILKNTNNIDDFICNNNSIIGSKASTVKTNNSSSIDKDSKKRKQYSRKIKEDLKRGYKAISELKFERKNYLENTKKDSDSDEDENNYNNIEEITDINKREKPNIFHLQYKKLKKLYEDEDNLDGRNFFRENSYFENYIWSKKDYYKSKLILKDNNNPYYFRLRIDNDQPGPNEIKNKIHMISPKNMLFDCDLSSDEERIRFTEQYLKDILDKAENVVYSALNNENEFINIYNLQYENGTYWNDYD
jgi:hypothetical protein